jgi:hypothetical protein
MLTPSEQDALKAVLRQTQPDLFQSFNQPFPGNILFNAFRIYVNGPSMLPIPSFIMSPDSISIILLTKLGDSKDPSGFGLNNDYRANNQNLKMKETLFKIQEALGGFKSVSFNRTGKIYEFVFGPFAKEQKQDILKRFAQYNDADIGEMHLLFTKYTEVQKKSLHIRHEIGIVQEQSLDQPFLLNIKIDINNRTLQQQLDQNDISQIWNIADNSIDDVLNSLIVSN